jgi:hypothetical protein
MQQQPTQESKERVQVLYWLKTCQVSLMPDRMSSPQFIEFIDRRSPGQDRHI